MLATVMVSPGDAAIHGHGPVADELGLLDEVERQLSALGVQLQHFPFGRDQAVATLDAPLHEQALLVVFRDVLGFGCVLRCAHEVYQMPLHRLRLPLSCSSPCKPHDCQRRARRDCQHPHPAPPQEDRRLRPASL